MDKATKNDEKRIAVLGIILEDRESSKRVNELLHEFGDYIEGRMGIPKVRESICIISVVLNAEINVINSLTGRLGMISGVKAKTLIR